jgi:regulator of protease activity HflC (stomatin/prohibitin superfamily)
MSPFKLFAGIIAAFVLILGIGTAGGSFYTVTTGETGVIYRNGQIVNTAGPGLHWKTPWIDSVEHVNTKTARLTYDKVDAFTSDQQITHSKITVIFHLDPAKLIPTVSRFGLKYWDTIITPVVPTEYKSVINANNSVQIISSRDKMSADTADHVREKLAESGVILESVQLENIDFSPEYQHAIETAMQARAEVQREEQILQKKKVEAQQKVVDAKAKADANIEDARGQAESTRLRAVQEAEALRVVGEQLAKNPLVIEKLKAERWDGKLPTTMPPGSTVPFINIAPAPTK